MLRTMREARSSPARWLPLFLAMAVAVAAAGLVQFRAGAARTLWRTQFPPDPDEVASWWVYDEDRLCRAAVLGSPARVEGDRVGTRLLCLDRATGRLLWRHRWRADSAGLLIWENKKGLLPVGGRYLVMSASDPVEGRPAVLVLDAGTGETVWEVPAGAAVGQRSGVVYVTGFGGHPARLAALAVASRQVLWEIHLAPDTTGLSGDDVDLRDDKLVVTRSLPVEGITDGVVGRYRFEVFDAGTGRFLWAREQPRPRTDEGTYFVDDIRLTGFYAMSIDPTGDSGALIRTTVFDPDTGRAAVRYSERISAFRREAPGSYATYYVETQPQPALVALRHSAGFGLVSLRSPTGELRHRFPVGKGLFTAPLPQTDGRWILLFLEPWAPDAYPFPHIEVSTLILDPRSGRVIRKPVPYVNGVPGPAAWPRLVGRDQVL